MKVGTLLFFALYGLLTVVHSAPTNILAQEEVYREAMTDGYVIDNVYLNWFTTESSKTQTSQQPSSEEEDLSKASEDTSDEAETSVILQYGSKATTATPRASNTEQPLLESIESDLLEGSGDTTIMSVFPQHHESTSTSVSSDWSTEQTKESDLLEGSGDTTITSVFPQHHESTTTSVSPDWSTQQTKESDLLEGSGDSTITSVFPQHHESTTTSVSFDWIREQAKESDLLKGSRDVTSVFSQPGPTPDVSTTASVTHARSPSPAKDSDGFDSEDTSTTSSISTPILKKNFTSTQGISGVRAGAINGHPETQKKDSTQGWIIILACVVGVAVLIMVCIAVVTRDKWSSPNKAPSPDSKSNKMKSINQQKAVEMETFLHNDQPRENGLVREYTVIPLDDLPEKYSSD